MFSFFYTNISQLTRNFDGMNGDGNNKKTKRMYLSVWKDHYFKSAGVSMM